MRVLALLPSWGTTSGAFITGREYAHALADAGHDVEVWTTWTRTARRWDRHVLLAGDRHRWRGPGIPDVAIFNHGDRAAPAMLRLVPARLRMLMCHGYNALPLAPAAVEWFPSRHCADHYVHHGEPIVLPPPVDPAEHRAEPGTAVTLNGSSRAKGGDVVAELARRMPDVRFLVVRGSGQLEYGLPAPNIELIERGEPLTLWSRTRVLLMPSIVESYGRVAVEAGYSGIPTVASDLPGIQEAMGDGATYIRRKDLDGWEAAVRHLVCDSGAWAEASCRARARSESIDYQEALDAFVGTVEDKFNRRHL